MKKRLLIFIGLHFCILVVQGQDFRYTQYNYSPLLVNPALAASAYHLTIQANYRLQYRQPNPNYYTPSLTFILPFIHKENQRRWGGIGLSAISDKAGNVPQLLNQGIALSYAQNLYLGGGFNMSLGLQGGFYERRFDADGLTSGSQYSNPGGFDPSASLNEASLQNRKTYTDLAGGVYVCKEDSNFNRVYYVGLSSRYLNRPDVAFISTSDKNLVSGNSHNGTLNPTFTFLAGIRVYADSKWTIIPDIQVNKLENNYFLNGGVSIHYYPDINKASFLNNTRISILPRYVFQNAVGMGLELRKNNFFMMVHYETYVANTAWRAGTQGIMEVAVGYSHPLVKKKEPEPLPEYKLSDIKKYYPKDEVKEVQKQIEARQATGNYEYIGDNDTTWYRDRKSSFELEKHFKYGFNQTQLSEDGKAFIVQLLELMKKNSRVKLLVVGFTDNVGPEEVNFQISKERAKAFTDYLIENGISPNRLRFEGKGETEALNENRTREQRGQNRRVKFLIY